MRLLQALTAGIWCAIAVFLLCSTGPSVAEQPSAAELRFRALATNVKMLVNFDLVSATGLTPTEKDRREKEAAELFKPACLKPYTETLQTAVKSTTERAKAERSLAPLEPLPPQARFLDAGFDTCLAKYGVSGFNFVLLESGREIRVPAYLEETIAALKDWGAARVKANRGRPSDILTDLAAVLGPGRPVFPNAAHGAASCFESSIQKPAPFMGNHGEVFRLADGSLWEVEYEYEYLYEYYPEVVMCPGVGKLLIKGKRLSVQQLR
jgi:hypothetical protein